MNILIDESLMKELQKAISLDLTQISINKKYFYCEGEEYVSYRNERPTVNIFVILNEEETKIFSIFLYPPLGNSVCFFDVTAPGGRTFYEEWTK